LREQSRACHTAARQEKDGTTRNLAYQAMGGPSLRETRAARQGDGLRWLGARLLGNHFEVDKSIEDDGHVERQREILERNGLECFAIGNHLVGQGVCDSIDERHRATLPQHVWADGVSESVRQRAAEEIKNTPRAAARLGVEVVTSFTGFSIWHKLYYRTGVDPAVGVVNYKLFRRVSLGGNKRRIGHLHRLPGALLLTQRFQFTRTGTSTLTPEESLRLAPLDQIGRYGVAVPIVPTYSVGCVGGVYEGHNRHYSHHRDEQKPNQYQGQEPRYRPANC
jgi:hypothetical protein